MRTRRRPVVPIHALRVAAMAALLGAALQAFAQPAPAPTQAQSPAPSQTPLAIPAAEIPERAERASEHLRGLEDRLEPAPAYLEIKKALPEREQLLEQVRQRDAKQLGKLGLRELENARQSWLRRQAELEGWQSTLQARLESLGDEQKALDTMDAQWRATREATRSGVPEMLEQRSRDIVSDITRARTQLNNRFDDLLGLQDRVSRLQELASDMLSQIEQAQKEARNALLRLDSPPLWRAFGGEGDLRGQLHDSATIVRQSVEEWYQSFRPQVYAHAIIILVLIGLIVLMRRRTRDWPRVDESINAAMHVLSHPVASALLVGLMIAPMMYPRASVVIRELTTLAIIIPLLRLLPGLVYGPMRTPVYALGVLYTLSRLHTLALPRSGLDRLILLSVTVLALAGLLALLRPSAALDKLSVSRWWRAAIRVARIASLALAIALLANVFGAVALSEVLVEATFASAIVAAALLAFVLVIRGVIAILLRTQPARVLHSVQLFAPLIERRIAAFLHLAALALWLLVTAMLLNVLRPAIHVAKLTLSATWKIGNVSVSFGDVCAFLIGVYLALLASRFIRFVLEEDVLPRLPLARGVPNTVTMLANYTVLGLGFLVALGAAGVDLSRLTIVAGALGVGIGFGLQNVVNNFVSGLILAFERPVQLGDVIEVGKNVGEVKRIGIRSSTIRTGQGAEVIVPNASLISNEVVNWTLSDRERRFELNVGVSYDNDPARVVDLLRETVLAHPKVSAKPAPIITFDGFGESALDFTVRYWGTMDDVLQVGSEVAIAIHHALAKAGMEIPFPVRDLRLRSVDPQAAEALRREPDGARRGPDPEQS